MSPGIFLIRAIMAMAPVFTIWWFIGSSWLLPAVYLTEELLLSLMPKIISTLQLSSDTVLALTHWARVEQGFIPAIHVGASLGTEFNVRILSYSFPFYISLQVALWQLPSIIKIASSLAALYLLIIISLAFVIVKRLMINMQLIPVFEQTTDSWVFNQDFISMGFQLATLLIPTLAPVMLWAFNNQNHLKEIIKR